MVLYAPFLLNVTDRCTERQTLWKQSNPPPPPPPPTHSNTMLWALKQCRPIISGVNIDLHWNDKVKKHVKIYFVPIATKVVCFSHLLKCLRSLYGKQCGPRSDCSCRSSLFWVHTVCFYTEFVSNDRQLFASDNFSRQHFQMHFFFWAL